jgi:hypothetical protein
MRLKLRMREKGHSLFTLEIGVKRREERKRSLEKRGRTIVKEVHL